jgi:hypothetical protein
VCVCEVSVSESEIEKRTTCVYVACVPCVFSVRFFFFRDVRVCVFVTCLCLSLRLERGPPVCVFCLSVCFASVFSSVFFSVSALSLSSSSRGVWALCVCVCVCVCMCSLSLCVCVCVCVLILVL